MPGRIWCGRRDSNPHDLRHGNLNPARLPIPPRPRALGLQGLARPGRGYSTWGAARKNKDAPNSRYKSLSCPCSRSPYKLGSRIDLRQGSFLPRERSMMMLSRRRFLAAGLAATAIPLVGRRGLAQTADGFRVITLKTGEALLRGRDRPATPIWGYDGMVPGPTLRVRRGDEVKVRIVNRLDTAYRGSLARHPHRKPDGRRTPSHPGRDRSGRELRLPLQSPRRRDLLVSPALARQRATRPWPAWPLDRRRGGTGRGRPRYRAGAR